MKKLILRLVAKSNLSDYKKAAIADIITCKDFALFTFDESGMSSIRDCTWYQLKKIDTKIAIDYHRMMQETCDQDAAVEEALRIINK